jgi:succinate dehydrogenase, cytochrome b556 subunit
MATVNRPLSPHLQVYRWQLPMVLSILHRGTGILLSIGTPFLVYWLAAIAAGPTAYKVAQDFFGSQFGQPLLLAWSFALFYHLCNGIRHLFWDAGFGFELKVVYASGWAVVITSSVLTALAWILGLRVLGGT